MSLEIQDAHKLGVEIAELGFDVLPRCRRYPACILDVRISNLYDTQSNRLLPLAVSWESVCDSV
jgi:hypothetical protein